jgi:MFS family permease
MRAFVAVPPPPAHSLSDSVAPGGWAWLLFLTLLNILNFVDRTLLASLAPLLISELGLTRAEIGLLAGFGFVVLYTLVGLLLGVAADRWRRSPLVAAGLALWSAMTALSGLARSFAQLALPRLFVGVGEATLTPSALSMIGDLFPSRRLGLASGIYYAGVPLGSAVSLIAASWIAPRYGWRACFYLLGAAGLVASLGFLVLREPRRRALARAGASGALRMGELVRELGSALVSRRELALTLAGGALVCYGSASAIHTVTWLVEERGFLYPEAALTAGLVSVAAGLLGNLAGGAFADACARRWPNGRLRALIALALFFAAASPLFYLLPPRTPLFYLGWFLSSAGASAWFGPFFATVQELAPAATRASAVALGLLTINLLGVGPGPLVTGRIGDLHGLTAGLMASLAVVALATVPFALALRRPSTA